MNKMKIIFYGTPAFAVQNLDYLHKNNFTVAAVVTAPDKRSGRGKKMHSSAVKKYALANNIPVLQPENLKAESFVTKIKHLAPDCQVVVAFRMLPESVWSLSRLGTINLHASLLPNYRGAAPINWVIKNNEKHTGLTTFLIDDKIDTGAVLLQKRIAINPKETAGSLHDRLAELGGPLLQQTLSDLNEGKIFPQPQQIAGNVKSAPKLNRETIRINWQEKLSEVECHIRAMSPYPGAWTSIIDQKGQEQQLKIFSASTKFEAHGVAPKRLLVKGKEIYISTEQGYLICEEIQLPNKRKMLAAELLNGYNFPKQTMVL